MTALPIKELLSAVAIALTFALFVPYVRGILRGDLKPHVFSWVIWGLACAMLTAMLLWRRGVVPASGTGVDLR
jgi:hypothetical protein